MDIPKPDGPDVSIAPRMLAVCWTLYGVAAVVIALRLVAKVRLQRRVGLPGLDDILMTFALLLSVTNLALNTWGVRWGLGRHFYYLTPVERVKSMKAELSGEPVGVLSPTFGRIAFMVYLLQIVGTQKSARWFVYFLIGQHAIVNVVTIILILVQCPHFETLWDPVGHPGICWSPIVIANFGYFQGAANTLTDLALTVLPAFFIRNLQVAMRLKVGLSILLGLSSIAMVASIARTRRTAQIADRSDFTYNTIDFIIWCTVENATVMITASIPTLRSLFICRKPPNSAYEMQSEHNRSKGHGLRSSLSSEARSKIKSQIISKCYAGPGSSEENMLSPQAVMKSTTVIFEADSDSRTG